MDNVLIMTFKHISWYEDHVQEQDLQQFCVPVCPSHSLEEPGGAFVAQRFPLHFGLVLQHLVLQQGLVVVLISLGRFFGLQLFLRQHLALQQQSPTSDCAPKNVPPPDHLRGFRFSFRKYRCLPAPTDLLAHLRP